MKQQSICSLPIFLHNYGEFVELSMLVLTEVEIFLVMNLSILNVVPFNMKFLRKYENIAKLYIHNTEDMLITFTYLHGKV